MPPVDAEDARNYKARSHHLTKTQSDFVNGRLENYWAFIILSNDSGRWSARDIARKVGLSEKAVGRALLQLVKLKLATKDREGRYSCPLAGRVFVYPREALYRPTHVDARRRHLDELSKKHGGTLLHQQFLTRACESELQDYFPQLIQSVNGADLYTTKNKGPNTAFFLIETIVRKIIPF